LCLFISKILNIIEFLLILHYQENAFFMKKFLQLPINETGLLNGENEFYGQHHLPETYQYYYIKQRGIACQPV